jgi:hypothetical protein
MIVKSTLLAVAVFLGSVNLAEAQPYTNGGIPNPGIVLGWNYGYISFCTAFSDGVTTWFFGWFPGWRLCRYKQSGFRHPNSSSLPNLAGIHVISLNPFLCNWAVAFLYQ